MSPLSERDAKFATVINCMDGRTQLPAMNYIKENTGAEFVDTITEAGPVGILAELGSQHIVESIRRRVSVSVDRHGSRRIFVVAHCDCAGNPVPESVQKAQLEKAVEVVESWGFDAEVGAIWVDANFHATAV